MSKKLFVSEKPYTLRRFQEDGERDLGDIAEKAGREHSWVFYRASKLWRFLDGQHPGGDAESLVILHDASHETVPVIYYVHPDLYVEGGTGGWDTLGDPLEYSVMKNRSFAFHSFPYNGNIRAAAKYKDFQWRIRTTRGITTFKVESDKILESDMETLVYNKLWDSEEFTEVFLREDFNSGMAQLVGSVNDDLAGLVAISYMLAPC